MQFSYRVIIKQRRDIECRLEGWGHSGLLWNPLVTKPDSRNILCWNMKQTGRFKNLSLSQSLR